MGFHDSAKFGGCLRGRVRPQENRLTLIRMCRIQNECSVSEIYQKKTVCRYLYMHAPLCTHTRMNKSEEYFRQFKCMNIRCPVGIAKGLMYTNCMHIDMRHATTQWHEYIHENTRKHRCFLMYTSIYMYLLVIYIYIQTFLTSGMRDKVKLSLTGANSEFSFS